MFKKIYNKYQYILSLLLGFFVSMKLMLAFIPLFPLVTLYILSKLEVFYNSKDKKSLLKEFCLIEKNRTHLNDKYFLLNESSSTKENYYKDKYDYRDVLIYFILFICSTIICCIFGIDPLKSFRSFISLITSSLTLVIIYDTALKHEPLKLLTALMAGVTVSSFTSNILKIVYKLFNLGEEPRLFLGDVTQSGQLSLTLFATLSILYILKDKNAHTLTQNQKNITNY